MAARSGLVASSRCPVLCQLVSICFRLIFAQKIEQPNPIQSLNCPSPLHLHLLWASTSPSATSTLHSLIVWARIRQDIVAFLSAGTWEGNRSRGPLVGPPLKKCMYSGPHGVHHIWWSSQLQHCKRDRLLPHRLVRADRDWPCAFTSAIPPSSSTASLSFDLLAFSCRFHSLRSSSQVQTLLSTSRP